MGVSPYNVSRRADALILRKRNRLPLPSDRGACKKDAGMERASIAIPTAAATAVAATAAAAVGLSALALPAQAGTGHWADGLHGVSVCGAAAPGSAAR